MNKDELIKYDEFLFRAALSKCGNLHDAEDLTQETLLSALAVIEKGQLIQNPKAWLISVLSNKCNSMLRRKYFKADVSYFIGNDIPVYENIEKLIETSEIRQGIAFLAQTYREVLIRFYMKGESIKRIAQDLKIPQGTVKSRLDTGEYPERPQSGKWFCMGNHFPADYKPEFNYEIYNISGEAGIVFDNYRNSKYLRLCEFDTVLGKTHSAYNRIKNIHIGDVLKMLYAVYTENDSDFDILDKRFIENLGLFAYIGYLYKTESGMEVDLPIINSVEWKELCDLSDKYDKIIINRFRDLIKPITESGVVKPPQHLKNIPGYQKYMHCVNFLPMMIILNAKNFGLFLKDIDAISTAPDFEPDGSKPCPAAIMVMDL